MLPEGDFVYVQQMRNTLKSFAKLHTKYMTQSQFSAWNQLVIVLNSFISDTVSLVFRFHQVRNQHFNRISMKTSFYILQTGVLCMNLFHLFSLTFINRPGRTAHRTCSALEQKKSGTVTSSPC